MSVPAFTIAGFMVWSGAKREYIVASKTVKKH